MKRAVAHTLASVVSTVALTVAIAACSVAVFGQGVREPMAQAYYLENVKGDFAAAAKIYEGLAAAGNADKAARAEAESRLADCREEMASADLARLMPPSMAYLEMNGPGGHFRELLDKMGLLARGGQVPVPGQNRLAISPALIDVLMGGKMSAAVAVTGLDPASQRPTGVMVFRPGHQPAVLGILSTLLQASAQIKDPARGFALYEIEGVTVALTRRLVVAGTSPGEIEGVLDRLQNPSAPCLLTDPSAAASFKDRRGQLLFFYLNPKPLLPMVEPLLQKGGAIASAVDLKSLSGVTASMDVGGGGLVADLTLRLDEGHRSLAFDFVSGTALDKAMLGRVPQDAAAVFALALSKPAVGSTGAGTPPESGKAKQPSGAGVLDIARQILDNVEGVAVFALQPAPDGARPGPIPDLAAVVALKSPSQTNLIGQLLGLAGVLASEAPGSPREISGTPVASFKIDGKVTLFTATSGNTIVVAASETAMARTLGGMKAGKSILDDPGFAPALASLGPGTAGALLCHAGRCVETATPFVSADDAAGLARVKGLFSSSTLALVLSHGERTMKLSLAISGVPDISGVVAQMLVENQKKERLSSEIRQAARSGQWDRALELLDSSLAQDPKNEGALREKFEILALRKKDPAGAMAVAEKLVANIWDDALGLNNLAWALLTEDGYGKGYADLSLRLARQSNELSENVKWEFMDTLALALFESGDTAKAAELQEKTIEAFKVKAAGKQLQKLEESLKKYRDAAGAGKPATATP